MIYIYDNGEKIRFESPDEAIDFLKQNKKELFKNELLTFDSENETQWIITIPN